VRGLRRLPAADGVTWEFSLAPGTLGYRRAAASEAVVLEFARDGGGLEPFAPEGPAGPRALRVIVLDPGHGGDDTGVNVPGALEKDLSLQLARLLAGELERRTGARVLLTRDNDRGMTQPERAEMANRARADIVISLHFDGAPLTRARGATAWCPPLGASAGGDVTPASGIALTTWRDVAARHAVESRALADAVTAALESRGLGPARVRERLPVPLLGVNAPGLSLECATLTSADDLARVSSADGMRALATAIADGVQAWGRHE
jgi:N-acetylmuramoyl-L-alanine amidase